MLTQTKSDNIKYKIISNKEYNKFIASVSKITVTATKFNKKENRNVK